MELMKQNPNLKLKFASLFRQNDQAKKPKKDGVCVGVCS